MTLPLPTDTEQLASDLDSFQANEPNQPPYDNARWTIRDVTWSVLLGVAILLGFSGMAALAVEFGTLFLEAAPGMVAALMALGEVGLFVPIWALGIRKYRLPWSSVGFRGFGVSQGIGLGCLFVLIALGFNTLWALLLALLDLRTQPDVLPLFGGGAPGLLLALLVGGLVAPVAEEAFFRGYVFAGLRVRVGLARAAVISSALFALVHLVPTSWPPLFVLATLFAVLYDQTGSIWPAVGVHAMLNSVALLLSFYAEVSKL